MLVIQSFWVFWHRMSLMWRTLRFWAGSVKLSWELRQWAACIIYVPLRSLLVLAPDRRSSWPAVTGSEIIRKSDRWWYRVSFSCLCWLPSCSLYHACLLEILCGYWYLPIRFWTQRKSSWTGVCSGSFSLLWMWCSVPCLSVLPGRKCWHWMRLWWRWRMCCWTICWYSVTAVSRNWEWKGQLSLRWWRRRCLSCFIWSIPGWRWILRSMHWISSNRLMLNCWGVC